VSCCNKYNLPRLPLPLPLKNRGLPLILLKKKLKKQGCREATNELLLLAFLLVFKTGLNPKGEKASSLPKSGRGK
jgi:hypothetical protein